ncbi:GerAB/ArcD/ProY family transporter [Cytobacillus depressus]|uniref:GerAB/ArcD/ProY family transporter n=1 Tax=Cytobacillus depressus TaxID=1602942 RepID=A0A6L3V7A3_9BACI|nr:GerAB/ArcD/ProY family transporter [Cytobacillus depressus]KAB2337312.1 GerAB/ArcD/ProY family transporter [Cytobacillus depressus]
MKTNWSAAFQIAAVYVGTVVGAGFATGKEIVEFFSRFGFIGLLSILMSGYIFIFLGSKLMRIAARIQATSYQELNEYLFGRFIGSLINIIMLVMLLGVCAVMLSGAGAVFEEQIGLSKYTGIFVTIALSIVVMILGTKGLFAVNTFVVPMMIAFSFLLLFISMKLPNFTEQILYIPFAEDGWKSVAAPFSYAALNLSLAQAVLVPIASEIKHDQTIKWGGILGGVALTLILISSHLTLVMLPQLETYAIPMAVIMKTSASSLFWIYVFIIYGEIFTSVIGNVYGIERQVRKYIPIPTTITVCFIFIICFFISLINYGTLLAYLYPLFGYISVIFIVLLWMKPFKGVN